MTGTIGDERNMDDLVKVSIGDFVFRSVLSSLLFASLPIFDPFYLFSNCPILISDVNNFNNPICVSKIFLSYISNKTNKILHRHASRV